MILKEEKSPEVRGLERSLKSLEAQMKIQQKQAQELAAAVKSAFLESGGLEGVTIVDAAAAIRACKLAEDVLF